MKHPSYFRSISAKFFHASETQADMDEELRSHIQHRADDLERFGLDRVRTGRSGRLLRD